MWYKCILVFFCVSMSGSVFGQIKIDLYPEGVLNVREGVDLGNNKPELFYFKPENQKYDKAFLIIPGGGYAKVAIGHEGHDVAKRLQDLGYVSYVLRYRLPVDSQMLDKRITPIQDAQTAMAYIRKQAQNNNVKHIGVLGFSAGGHLASTLSTHFNTSYIGENVKDNLRPDFSVLVYPVITMNPGVTHQGSKTNLIGPHFFNEDVIRFSNENQVTSETPVAYLVHAADDKAVPIDNSLIYQKALDRFGISNSLYKYAEGGHGFGMTNSRESGDWLSDMLIWIEGQSLDSKIPSIKK